MVPFWIHNLYPLRRNSVKISSKFHAFVFFMVGLTFSMPFATLAQQNSVEAQAIIDAATMDANKDVNKPLWFGTGCLMSGLVFLPLPGWSSCLLPPVGLTGTYFYQPEPPLARLMGKSPEYVEAYTSTYKSTRGNIQVRWASAGCITGGVIVGSVLFGIGVGVAAALTEQ